MATLAPTSPRAAGKSLAEPPLGPGYEGYTTVKPEPVHYVHTHSIAPATCGRGDLRPPAPGPPRTAEPTVDRALR